MEDYLTVEEKRKYEIIKAVVNHRKPKKRAMIELNCSIRTINRLIIKYRQEGRVAFLHKNKGRKPITTIPEEIKHQIVQLYCDKYHGFNFTHFHEKLVESEGIHVSLQSIRNILHNAHILSPKASRKTKAALKKRLKEKESLKKLSPRDEKLLTALEQVEPVKAHPSRPRKKFMGELLQMDASQHRWFADKVTHLHAAIDDATGLVVGAFFDTQETLNAYYEITEQFINQYGIPVEILTDNRSIFTNNKEKEPSYHRKAHVQYAYACQTLGIKLNTSSIPQKKGRIERLWGSFQDRLVNELTLQGIQTLDDANAFLPNFIQKYNEKYALPFKNTMSVFEKLAPDTNLDFILCRLEERKINNGHAIQFQNHYYQLLNDDGTSALFPPKTSVLVIQTKQDVLYATVKDQVFILEEIPRNEAYSKNFDTEPQERKKRTYTPPINHPWRQANFRRFCDKEKKPFRYA